MIASVLIEYSVKKLDRTFDYIVPFSLEEKIKVGHKVLVPFGNSSKEIEGFVLSLNKNKTSKYDLKEIKSIVEEDFVLNDELLELGSYLSKRSLCTLISAYQVMLPKALKASYKSNVSKKYSTYVYIDDDVSEYILNNPRKKKEIEILELLKNGKVLKSDITSKPSLRNLIINGIVKEELVEVNREASYIKEDPKKVILNESQDNAVKEILDAKDNKKILLYGVTGSGKT